MGRRKERPSFLACHKAETLPRIIGIVGAGKCTGVTHFSILMLNYLCGFLRRRAVLMEWIPSGDLKQLQKACLRKEGGLGIFCLLSGTYLMTAGAEGLAVALGGGYEDILIDFGDGNEGNWAEFLRCDRQFLIGSLSEWQLERFREFEMSRRPDGKKTWRTLAAFGSEETRREMNRRYRMEVERIPFSADAFAITNECRIFFDRLLSENCR